MFFDNLHKRKTYPLLPFSQLVYDVTRWMPSLYRFPCTFVIRGGAGQEAKVRDALQTALSVHGVFRMRTDRLGRQYKAENRDILHGKYHDFRFETRGEDLYLYCSLNRILGDGKSMMILMEDVSRAYKGELIMNDHYWDYLDLAEERRQDKHYQNSKLWLEQQFADETIPVRPPVDRHCLFTLLPPKAGVQTLDLTAYKKGIMLLSEREHLSLDGLFSLCTALAIADCCGTDTAALTWAYEGRETTEEQRIVGSLHRDVPFVISRKSKVKSRKSKVESQKSKEDLIRQARNQIRSGIAHSDYPYTLTKPHTDRWNYAVNVIRSVAVEDSYPSQIKNVELLPQKPQRWAYALLDVEYRDAGNSLALTFRYSATHYKHESISRFAELVKQNVEWLINNSQNIDMPIFRNIEIK